MLVTNATEAIASVRRGHPRIRKGTWYAHYLPFREDPTMNCWVVTLGKRYKNKPRVWYVDPVTGEAEES